MSEDGFSDCFDEPNMEIQIKTLMGTSFDMKVSSSETIGDIKRKIYRVEGIPIYQQNLIFQSKELNDTSRLSDAGIKNGSILTLVASMRGGPISTRRLSIACEHHVVLKELKELLENTRDEIGDKLAPGSKVSVLVFKEGDIINLLRVIENEDGSYSPYSEKPISPPTKPNRKEGHNTTNNIFERLVEDNDMSSKIANLRRKMEDVHLRRQSTRFGGECSKKSAAVESPPILPQSSTVTDHLQQSFKLLTECANDLLDNVDLRIFEQEENHSETEEIALKDKHRSKPNYRLPVNHRYKKQQREEGNLATTESDEASSVLAPRNRLHLARLVLESSDHRPKSTPDSIELEENAQDLWEIHEPASERLKHSATCKVGLLKRRQSLDFGGFDGIDNGPNVKPDYCNNAEFDFYHHHMPQFVSSTGAGTTTTTSSPSAIPPQYAPKAEHYYFRNNPRSPLYGRKTKKDSSGSSSSSNVVSSSCNDVEDGANQIQSNNSNNNVLNNNNNSISSNFVGSESSSLFKGLDEVDDLYGYYNLGCSTELLDNTTASSLLTTKNSSDIMPSLLKNRNSNILKKNTVVLPPVTIKKKARCSECNRRLNITNIYDCRCGKIFCSQHRYSEVHHCSYDYKTEGRRLLQQQNPLVQAEKLNKI